MPRGKLCPGHETHPTPSVAPRSGRRPSAGRGWWGSRGCALSLGPSLSASKALPWGSPPSPRVRSSPARGLRGLGLPERTAGSLGPRGEPGPGDPWTGRLSWRPPGCCLCARRARDGRWFSVCKSVTFHLEWKGWGCLGSCLGVRRGGDRAPPGDPSLPFPPPFSSVLGSPASSLPAFSPAATCLCLPAPLPGSPRGLHGFTNPCKPSTCPL